LSLVLNPGLPLIDFNLSLLIRRHAILVIQPVAVKSGQVGRDPAEGMDPEPLAAIRALSVVKRRLLGVAVAAFVANKPFVVLRALVVPVISQRVLAGLGGVAFHLLGRYDPLRHVSVVPFALLHGLSEAFVLSLLAISDLLVYHSEAVAELDVGPDYLITVKILAQRKILIK
jgi:hypothetical protein